LVCWQDTALKSLAGLASERHPADRRIRG